MNKKKFILFIISLTILIVIGSLHAFNTGNLLMSDVANYESGVLNYPYIFTTFSHMTLTFTFILSLFFIVRFYSLEKEYRVHMIKTYSIIQMAFGLDGIIFTILSATLAYHSFLAPYPYPGAIIVALILNILVLLFALMVFIYIKVKKFEDIKKPYKFKHVGRTIIMALLAYISFNRFGALLAMGYYTEWHYLYLTIWFYLTLPLPLIIMIMFILFRIRIITKKNVNGALIASIILFVISTALCLTVMIIGMNEPMLISLISPAMPLERLATIPLDFIIIVLSSVVPTLITMIFEIMKKIKRVKSLKQEENH